MGLVGSPGRAPTRPTNWSSSCNTMISNDTDDNDDDDDGRDVGKLKLKLKQKKKQAVGTFRDEDEQQ